MKKEKITCQYCGEPILKNKLLLHIRTAFHKHIHIRCPNCGIISYYWTDLRIVHNTVPKKDYKPKEMNNNA